MKKMNMNLAFANSTPYKVSEALGDSERVMQFEIAKQACNIANELKKINDNIDFFRNIVIAQILEHEERDEHDEWREKEARRNKIEAWRPNVGDKIKIVKPTEKTPTDGQLKVGDVVEVTKIDLSSWEKKIELSIGDLKKEETFEALKQKLDWGIIELVKEA